MSLSSYNVRRRRSSSSSSSSSSKDRRLGSQNIHSFNKLIFATDFGCVTMATIHIQTLPCGGAKFRLFGYEYMNVYVPVLGNMNKYVERTNKK